MDKNERENEQEQNYTVEEPESPGSSCKNEKSQEHAQSNVEVLEVSPVQIEHSQSWNTSNKAQTDQKQVILEPEEKDAVDTSTELKRVDSKQSEPKIEKKDLEDIALKTDMPKMNEPKLVQTLESVQLKQTTHTSLDTKNIKVEQDDSRGEVFYISQK